MPVSWDKAKKRWRFRFRRVIDSHRHRASRLLPAGWSRAQADAYDRQESARLYALASGVERDRPLIETAVRLYLDHRVPQLRDAKKTAQVLALIYPAYQGRFLDELADVCSEYIADNKDLAAATVRNRLAYLCSACRYAFRHHKLGAHDPAERVVLPVPRNARNNFPQRADVLRIMRACQNRDSRAVIALAFYTGMRWQSEILRARFDGDMLIADTTKNGKPHVVPVHPKAYVYARRLPRIRLKPWSIYKYFKMAAKSLGLGYLTMHDQRHGTASALINSGASLSEVGGFLNHSSPQATARYAHLVMATKRAQLKRLA